MCVCVSVLYSMDISIDESDNKDQSISSSIVPNLIANFPLCCTNRDIGIVWFKYDLGQKY